MIFVVPRKRLELNIRELRQANVFLPPFLAVSACSYTMDAIIRQTVREEIRHQGESASTSSQAATHDEPNQGLSGSAPPHQRSSVKREEKKDR